MFSGIAKAVIALKKKCHTTLSLHKKILSTPFWFDLFPPVIWIKMFLNLKTLSWY